MDMNYRHTGWRLVLVHSCLVLTLLQALSAGPARSEETGVLRAEPDSDQHDMYYDAMIRSIELDKSRWKSFSRSMESGPWFFDAQSLKRDGDRLAVLVTVFPHPNKTELYSSVYPKHTKIRKIVFVTEIDCSKRTYRQPQISVYGYIKELLAEHSSAGKIQGFSPIKPGTTTDTLRGLVCAPVKKKRK